MTDDLSAVLALGFAFVRPWRRSGAAFATVQAAAFEQVWDSSRLIPMAGCQP